MAVKFSNNASTTLAADITNVATTIGVVSSAEFPTLASGDHTYVTLSNTTGSTLEIVKVTAMSGNSLTVVRAQDGTAGTAFVTGDLCELRLTAALLTASMDGKADASHGTHLTSNSVGISQLAVSDGSVGQVLSTDGSDTLSFITPAAGVNITSSATAPTSPSVGDQWFDISSGILSTYMTDGTDSDWIDISSANGLAAASSGGGGAMVFISKTTVSSSVSSVAFTSISGYTRYVLKWEAAFNGAQIPKIQLYDNGTLVTSSSYALNRVTLGAASSFATTYSGVIGVAGIQRQQGTIELSLSESRPLLDLKYSGTDSLTSNTLNQYSSIGTLVNSYSITGINGINFTMTGGTIDSGIFSLYGIKDS
jgi:hypothetical protein